MCSVIIGSYKGEAYCPYQQSLPAFVNICQIHFWMPKLAAEVLCWPSDCTWNYTSAILSTFVCNDYYKIVKFESSRYESIVDVTLLKGQIIVFLVWLSLWRCYLCVMTMNNRHRRLFCTSCMLWLWCKF
jgi:hypothetical protein